jgi:uncharacterized membrane protein YhaH (DUF805 family)
MLNTDRAVEASPMELSQFVPLLFLAALVVVPAVKLLRRIGKSWAWTLVAFVPGVGPIILIWIVAFSRWEPQH